jgi:gliding motility-associated-like protein
MERQYIINVTLNINGSITLKELETLKPQILLPLMTICSIPMPFKVPPYLWRCLCLLSFVLFAFTSPARSQDKLYISLSNGEIGYIDLLTFTYHPMLTLPTAFMDIAIGPNGLLYGVDNKKMYEIDPVTLKYTSYIISGEYDGGNAMVSDKDGNLIVTSGGQLYKVDMKTKSSIQLKGSIGQSDGDLCFYDGKLYLTSNGAIVEIILDADKTTIISSKTQGILNFPTAYGMACDEYGICYGVSPRGQLALIDLYDAQCYVIVNPVKGNYNYLDIWGMAIATESKNDKPVEICGNGIDDDHNGYKDEEDIACRLQRGFCNTGGGTTIFKEDFGTGAGFGPALADLNVIKSYQYAGAAPLTEGKYTIVDNPRRAIGNNDWKDMGDHSGQPGGRMLIANASNKPGEFYRKKLSIDCSNKQFALAFSACSVVSPSMFCGNNVVGIPSRIRLRIEDVNGNLLAQLSDRYIPISGTNDPDWREYGFTFTLPDALKDIQIVFINDAPGGCGNDLALDDISLKICNPIIDMEWDGKNVNRFGACVGEDRKLSVRPPGMFRNPEYHWQYQPKEGGTWNDLQTGSENVYAIKNIQPSNTGLYRVIVYEKNATDACRLQVETVPAIVDVVKIPALKVTPEITVCEGALLSLKFETDAPLPLYWWTTPNGKEYQNSLPTIIPDISKSDEGIYTFTGQYDNYSCKVSATTKVVYQPRAVVDAKITTTNICEGVAIDVTGSTTRPVSSWDWSETTGSPLILQGNTSSPTFTWPKEGKFKLKVKVTGDCQQTTATEKEIVVNGLPVTGDFILPATICNSEKLILQATGYKNGVITWLNDHAVTTGGTTEVPEVNWPNAGTFQVSYKVTGTCGEKELLPAKSITVLSADLPPFTIGRKDLCEGDVLEVSYPYATNITWGIPAAANIISQSSNKLQLKWNVAGSYPIQMIAKSNCVFGEQTVTVNKYPSFVSPPDTIGCIGTPVQLNAPVGYTYSWINLNNPNQVLSTQSYLQVVAPGGQYRLMLNNSGCVTAYDRAVGFVAPPTVSLGKDTAFCLGSQVILHPVYSSDVRQFSWQNGPFSNTPSFRVDKDGTYKVTVKNEWGCTSEDNVAVKEMMCGCNVMLPSAFSPNNDGLHDIFRPIVNCVLLQFRLMVYNRWGNEVYASTNAMYGWDGTILNGLKAEIGTYVWVLVYKGAETPEEIRKTGTVTLLR